MKQELQQKESAQSQADRVALHSDNHLELVFDGELGAIHAVCKGYQSVGSIQDGCTRIQEAMVAHDARQVLYDHTQVVGIWRFASTWMAGEWFPQMKRTGLSRFAWVNSPAKLSQLSTALTLSLLEPRPFGIKVFHGIEPAKAWLASAAAPAPLKGRRLRAVVIEDTQHFAQLFCDMLQVMGCDATPVSTAQSGLELVRADPPDLIFCDIGLPGALDGFGFARALRADERLAGIPLIAVSGYANAENRQRASYAGFDMVCSKPVKFVEVSQIINSFLKREAARKSAE